MRLSNSLSTVGNTALQALELTAQIKRLTNGQIINNIRSMRDFPYFKDMSLIIPVWKLFRDTKAAE